MKTNHEKDGDRPPKVNLTGKKFGRLLVQSMAGFHVQPGGQRKRLWKCLCDCGEAAIAHHSNLQSGTTKSCGCLWEEHPKHTTHGCSKPGKWTAEYATWAGMIQRCTNPNNERWECYGGRGITVCERWSRFENFLEDMGNKPAGHTLERRNNSLGYCPSNCKWATWLEQASNKRNNRKISALGETINLSEWATKTGIKRATIAMRLTLGWKPDDAVSRPVSHSKYKQT